MSHALCRLDPHAAFPDTRSRPLNIYSVSKNVPDCNPVELRLHANTRQVGFAPLKGVDSVLEQIPPNQVHLVPPTCGYPLRGRCRKPIARFAKKLICRPAVNDKIDSRDFKGNNSVENDDNGTKYLLPQCPSGFAAMLFGKILK